MRSNPKYQSAAASKVGLLFLSRAVVSADVRRRASTMGDGAEAPPVADAARRRKGKQQADKRAFMPS